MLALEMIRIPAGYFLRGVDPSQADETEESPEEKIWVAEYEIQRHPVTVRQWLAFLEDARPQWPKAEWLAVCKENRAMPRILEDVPITYVNWHDCKAFANWLLAKSGKKYSLPTENQWEKACRGVNGQKYPWGDIHPNWQEEFLKEADPEGHFLLQPVGTRKEKATPFGVEEMWCNVQEWCEDLFLEDWNTKEPSNTLAPYRAVRGGNTIGAGWPRCTARQRIDASYRSYILGFRLVREPVT